MKTIIKMMESMGGDQPTAKMGIMGFLRNMFGGREKQTFSMLIYEKMMDDLIARAKDIRERNFIFNRDFARKGTYMEEDVKMAREFKDYLERQIGILRQKHQKLKEFEENHRENIKEYLKTHPV